MTPSVHAGAQFQGTLGLETQAQKLDRRADFRPDLPTEYTELTDLGPCNDAL